MPDYLVYKALIAAGHHPWKALEIAIDYQRGDRHAMAWVNVITNSKSR